MNLFLRFYSLFYIVTIEVLYLLLQKKGYYNASATSFGLHAGSIDVPISIHVSAYQFVLI